MPLRLHAQMHLGVCILGTLSQTRRRSGAVGDIACRMGGVQGLEQGQDGCRGAHRIFAFRRPSRPWTSCTRAGGGGRSVGHEGAGPTAK